MSQNLNIIDDYDPVGNSIDAINNNFNLFNVRTCNLLQSNISDLIPLYTSISQLSSKYENFSSVMSSFSANWASTASIVFNTKGHWLSPITLVYEKTFSTVANYTDIIDWLNLNFKDTFPEDQIIKVNYLIKTYSDLSLNGASIEKIDIADLDLLAGAYNKTTLDIKKYIIYKNHTNTIISIINNILLSAFRKDLFITGVEQINTYYDSYNIAFGRLSSSLIKDISYVYVEAIYTYLMQYQIIRSEYERLLELSIESIPSEILIKFDLQNIYGSFFGHFCFVQNGGEWVFTPQCNIMFCADNICNDCYGYIDPNTLYEGRQCFGNDLYRLESCPYTDIEPLSTYVSNNGLFADYVDTYMDMIVDGTSAKFFVSKNGTANYPNSAVLLKSRYTFSGLSIDQTCPYGEMLSFDAPIIIENIDEFTNFIDAMMK